MERDNKWGRIQGGTQCPQRAARPRWKGGFHRRPMRDVYRGTCTRSRACQTRERASRVPSPLYRAPCSWRSKGCTVRVQERRAGEGQDGWLPPGSPGSDLCWPLELRSGGAGGLSLAMGSPAGSPGSDPVRVLGAGSRQGWRNIVQPLGGGPSQGLG